MLAAVYCYLLGLLFLGNAGEAHTPALVILDWVAALVYILAGSVTGWQAARADD